MFCFPQNEPCLWHAFGLSVGRLSSRPKKLKASKDSIHFEYYVIIRPIHIHYLTSPFFICKYFVITRFLHNVKEIILLIGDVLYICWRCLSVKSVALRKNKLAIQQACFEDCGAFNIQTPLDSKCVILPRFKVSICSL